MKKSNEQLKCAILVFACILLILDISLLAYNKQEEDTVKYIIEDLQDRVSKIENDIEIVDKWTKQNDLLENQINNISVMFGLIEEMANEKE